MVAANDNEPERPVRADAAPVNDARANVTLTGDMATGRADPYTYTLPEARHRGSPPRRTVIDDLGECIAVRSGEAVILRSLIDEVIDQLRMKAANDNEGG